MSYKMFIDDKRYPVTPDFMIARSSGEAIMFVKLYGMPEHIAFDHDLGGDDTAMLFVKYLQHQLEEGKLTFPDNFSFSVHSQNTVGKRNIELLMCDLIEYFGEN